MESLQIIVVLSLFAVASAHLIPFSYHIVAHHPIAHEKKEVKAESWEPKAESWEKKEDETPKNYDYKYEVHDEKTGDIKRQSETASNGVVKGQYSLIDSDGFRRVVEYTADDHHGFQATVRREPTHFKVPQPEKKQEEPQHVHWW